MRNLWRVIRKHCRPFRRYVGKAEVTWADRSCGAAGLICLLAVLLHDPYLVTLSCIVVSVSFLAIAIGLAIAGYRRSLSQPEVHTREDIKGRWWH